MAPPSRSFPSTARSPRCLLRRWWRSTAFSALLLCCAVRVTRVSAVLLDEWTYELGATSVTSPVLYEPPGEMGRGVDEASRGKRVSPEHVVALLLVGANDGNLYAMHQGNGTVAWSRNFGSRLQARPVLTSVRGRDLLLLAAERGDLVYVPPPPPPPPPRPRPAPSLP